MKKELFNKCRKIKVVLTDIDGVLTDGGMYYTENGDVMKKFFARDGMGVTLLRKKGIPTIIVTKEKTKMVKKWAKKMNIEKLYDGISTKENILKIVCKKYNLTSFNVAFIGDDVNDLKLLESVGLSASPSDAILSVKNSCDYVCKTNGGRGCFRELADLILSC